MPGLNQRFAPTLCALGICLAWPGCRKQELAELDMDRSLKQKIDEVVIQSPTAFVGQVQEIRFVRESKRGQHQFALAEITSKVELCLRGDCQTPRVTFHCILLHPAFQRVAPHRPSELADGYRGILFVTRHDGKYRCTRDVFENSLRVRGRADVNGTNGYGERVATLILAAGPRGHDELSSATGLATQVAGPRFVVSQLRELMRNADAGTRASACKASVASFWGTEDCLEAFQYDPEVAKVMNIRRIIAENSIRRERLNGIGIEEIEDQICGHSPDEPVAYRIERLQILAQGSHDRGRRLACLALREKYGLGCPQEKMHTLDARWSSSVISCIAGATRIWSDCVPDGSPRDSDGNN